MIKSKPRYILQLLLLFLPLLMTAQGDSLAVEKTAPFRSHGVKLSLAHLVDPIAPGLHLEFEHSSKKAYYWRHQIGVFLNLGYTDQQAIEQLDGFRLRSGLRFYRNKQHASTSSSFWEFSIDYKYIDVLIGGDFRRSGFQERINYNIWQHSTSFNIIWGKSARINEHLNLDFGIGVGIRANYRQYSPIPDDAFFSTNGSVFLWKYGENEGWYPSLSVPFIFSLGYVW